MSTSKKETADPYAIVMKIREREAEMTHQQFAQKRVDEYRQRILDDGEDMLETIHAALTAAKENRLDTSHLSGIHNEASNIVNDWQMLQYYMGGLEQ